MSITEKKFAKVAITEEMRSVARSSLNARKMTRTRASHVDTWVGVLGEIVWSHFRYGDIHRLNYAGTAGRVDDDGGNAQVEVKTSKTNVWLRSHLMVRTDYARSRSPSHYVLVLIPGDQDDHQENTAYICGWASHDEVLCAPVRTRKSGKTGTSQGYECHEVPCLDLHPLSDMGIDLAGLASSI